MTGLRKVIRDEIIAQPNVLTIPKLVWELKGAYTECEVRSKLQIMLESQELGLDRDMNLFVKNSIEGATVAGVINPEGNWEPMISIPISEYEELREKAAMYDGLCK
jgi:hypothetical protein